MKYCIMLEDGFYTETNLQLIIINAHVGGSLTDLVILNKGSEFSKKMDIDENTIIIVDKNKKFINKDLELVVVKEDEIKIDYISYLKADEATRSRIDSFYISGLDGDTINLLLVKHSTCCNVPVIANTDICSSCHEHSGVTDKLEILESRDPIWLKNTEYQIIKIDEPKAETIIHIDNAERKKIKNMISPFLNVLVKIEPFVINTHLHPEQVMFRISKFIANFKMKLICTNGNIGNSDNNPNSLYPVNGRDRLNNPLNFYSCFIIKDEDLYVTTKTNKPLTLFVEKENIGNVIGTKGKNSSLLRDSLNSKNRFWYVPYIKFTPLEERHTNNDVRETQFLFEEFVKYVIENN